MPTQYAIDVEQRFVRTTISGVVTMDEVAAHIGRLRDDPEFDRTFSELVDLSNATDVRLGPADFHHLGSIDPFSKEARRAFLIPSQGRVRGITQVFHAMRNNNPQIRVVQNLAEAMDWLGKNR